MGPVTRDFLSPPTRWVPKLGWRTEVERREKPERAALQIQEVQVGKSRCPERLRGWSPVEGLWPDPAVPSLKGELMTPCRH